MNPIVQSFLEEVKALKARISEKCELNDVHLGSGYYDKQGHQVFYFPWEGVDEEDTSIEQLHYEFAEVFEDEPLLKMFGGWSNDRTCMPNEWVELLVQRAYDQGYANGFERAEEKMAERRRERDEP